MRQRQQSANRFNFDKTLSLARALTAGPLVVGILGAPFTWAQPTIAAPEFEVASVKPMPPSPMFPETGGPGTTDPGQITWSGVRLRWLLKTAYDVELYQISGPAWLDTEPYMIVAKVPEGATKEQVALMWQNLLKDRFGVVVHHESRVFQGGGADAGEGIVQAEENRSSGLCFPAGSSVGFRDRSATAAAPAQPWLAGSGRRSAAHHTWEGTNARASSELAGTVGSAIR